MTAFDDLFSQFVGKPTDSTTGTSAAVSLSVGQKSLLKQAEVAAAASKKREVLSGKAMSNEEAYQAALSADRGYGSASAPALTKAVNNESLLELINTDGPATALKLLNQQMAGRVAYDLDKNLPSNSLTNTTDSVLNTASGVVNTAAAPGILLGSVNDKLGTTLSGSLDAFNKLVESGLSDRSAASRRIAKVANELDTRDNQQQYEKDVANGNVMAKLAREGRNALGSIAIDAADPTRLLEGTTKAVGSMAAFGGVSKVISGGLKAAGLLAEAAMPLAGGLVSGGSVYNQVVSEVMSKSPKELAKISPKFNEYVASGMSAEDAQIRVASESGEYAASIAGPLGAMTTMMAPGLEKLPVKVGSIRGAIKSTAFEPIQEGVESFNEQVSANAGKRAIFDPSQDMLDGVGKAVGEGALYGFASAGATQTPGVIKRAAVGAADLAVAGANMALDYQERLGAERKKKADKANPVSAQNLTTQASEVAASVPQVAEGIQKAAETNPALSERAATFTAMMEGAMVFDPSRYEDQNDEFKSVFVGSKTKFDELVALKNAVENDKLSDATRDDAGSTLVDELGSIRAFIQTQQDIVDELPANSDVAKSVQKLMKMSADILESKEFEKVRVDVANRLAEKHKVNDPTELIKTSTDQAEVSKAVNEVIAVVESEPTKASLSAVEEILKQIGSDKLKLSADKVAQLKVAKAALLSVEDDLVDGTELARVATEAKSAAKAGEKGISALQHARSVAAAVAEKDLKLAKQELALFKLFAEHYQNKAAAINEAAFKDGPDYSVQYVQAAKGKWSDVPGVVTFQCNGGGINYATNILREAVAIGRMYNAIAESYPELGQEQIFLTKPESIFTPGGKFDIEATRAGISKYGIRRFKVISDSSQSESEKTKRTVKKAVSKKVDKPILTMDQEIAQVTSTGRNTLANEIERIQQRRDEPITDEEMAELISDSDVRVAKKVAAIKKKWAEKETPIPPTKPSLKTDTAENKTTSDDVLDTEPVKVTQTEFDATTTQESAKINVWYGSNENAGLSNLAAREFVLGGRKYFSVEHAYQTLKSGSFDEVTYKKYSGGGQKFAGKPAKTVDNYNIELMGQIMLASFTQNKKARDLLLSTGDAEFSHTQDGDVWATEFPRLLKKVREELHATTSISTPPPPPPAAAIVTPAPVVPKAEPSAASVAEELSAAPVIEFIKNPEQIKKLWEAKISLPGFITNFGFGDMFTPAGNLLKMGTRFVKNPRKQNKLLSDTDTPLKVLGKYLRSEMEAAGDKSNTKTAYKEMGTYVYRRAETIIAVMNELVEKSLHTKDQFFVKMLQLSPSDMLNPAKQRVDRFARNRLYSLLSPKEDGTPDVKLNDRLMELASLAFIQWELTALDSKSFTDEESLANLLGVHEFQITEDILKKYGNLIPQVEAIDMLGAKIMKYWSLEAIPDMPKGFNEGVAKVLAAEMLRALVNIPSSGVILETVTVPKEQLKNGKAHKTVNFIKLEPLSKNLQKHNKYVTDFIEKASFEDYEAPMYVGASTKVPVSKTVLRSPNQTLSDEQTAALDTAQKTAFKVDLPTYQLFKAIGKDGFYRLNGIPVEQLKAGNLNVAHAKSVEGKIAGISAALDKIDEMFDRVSAESEVSELALTDIPTYFKHEITSVGRMQMMGTHNPQANKFTRHVFMSTESVVDLTSESGYNNFMLGVAQGLGVSVNNMERSVSVATAVEILEKPAFKQAIVEIQNWRSGTGTSLDTTMPDSLINSLVTAFDAKAGYEFGPTALYALAEYARYEASSADEKAAFKTNMYVEADGVTNGPAAAIYMLAGLDELTEEFFVNMARTGYFVGSSDMTLNKARTKDRTDLYTAGAKKLPAELQKAIAADESGLVQSTLDVLVDLLPGMSLDDPARSILKNPLTITVYGSGASGMADKVVAAIADAYYENLSKAVELRSSGKYKKLSDIQIMALAFYGSSDESSVARFETLNSNLAKIGTDSNNYLELFAGKRSLVDMEFTNKAMLKMSENIQTAFTKPMVNAITKVVSPAVMYGSNLIVRATSLTGMFLEDEFLRAYSEKVEERKKQNPDFKKADGLSNNDLTSIEKKLLSTYQHLKTDTQSFDPNKTKRLFGVSEIGMTLDDHYPVYPSIWAPASPGVSAVPYMVIGLNDAKMMQDLAANPNGPKNVLQVFDGMNMPLSHLESYSEMANAAAWNAWQSNPMKVILPTMTNFVTKYDWSSFFERIAAEDRSALEMANKLGAVDQYGELKSDYKNIISKRVNNLISEVALGAARISATQKVLSEYEASYDQMASVGAPHYHKGASLIINSNTVEEINKKIDTQTTGNLATIKKTLPNVRQIILAGAKASSAAKPKTKSGMVSDAVQYLKENNKLDKDTVGLIDILMKSSYLENYYVVSTSYDELEKSIAEKVSPTDSGFTDTRQKKIYVLNDSVETFIHELIHAATYKIVHDVLFGKIKNQDAAIALKRIGLLKSKFMGLNTVDFPDIELAKQGIDGAKDEVGKLAEFIAWGLSNSPAKAALASKESILKKIAIKVKEQFAVLLKAVGITVPKNRYEDLVFLTTSLISNSEKDVSSETDGSILKMISMQTISDPRLQTISNMFGRVVDKYRKGKLLPGMENKPFDAKNTTNPREIYRAELLATQLRSLIAAKFPLNQQEKTTIGTIVYTLATAAKLDSNAMSGVEKLYADFTKKVKVEDFLLVDPISATQADMHEALGMYNLVLGNYKTGKDVQNRSQVLPIFLSLALVSSRFRNVLDKFVLDGDVKIDTTNLDSLLTSSANLALNKLDTVLSGQGNSKTTREAIDNIFSNLLKQSQENANFAELAITKSGSVIDGINEKITDKLQTIASAVNASNAPDKVKLLAKVFDKNSVDSVVEGISAGNNQSKMPKPLRELITDFIGRTASNSSIYDMVKYVRSSVQQDRQHYREELPTILASAFSRKLSDSEWSHLFIGLAKTDISQLMLTMKPAAIVELLKTPSKLSTAVSNLESTLRTANPRNWASIQRKSKQLANYMLTGKPGPMLLRNAFAISKIIGGNVKDADTLVTLYALTQLEQPTKDALSSLVQSEGDGIQSLISYLSGQRKDDAHPDPEVAINMYKGYIPSLPDESTSLRIEDDKEFNNLTEQGYVRIGNYNGSNLESGSSKGYYFLNAPARATFSQGVMQNINTTAGGIDVETKYSLHQTAGRISDPRYVNKIAKRGNNESVQVENLMPVFNAKGEIIAFERSLDPAMLSDLKHDTHLAKMIGVWRGRQVEEKKAKLVNEALVIKLHDMFVEEMRTKGNAGEYLNLFEVNDPVIQDAVRLFPQATRDQIKKLFGDDIFMVRKDMINNAIGYRTPSIGDAWTGVSGWSEKTLETAKNALLSVFGAKAYEYLVNGEQLLKNAIQDVKLIIVVKSVIVPASNFASNVIQLVSRGVPIQKITTSIPKKVAEVRYYTEQRTRKIELEVDLRKAEGNNDIVAIRKVTNELNSIEDSFRRLSIWPLIEAGEFSAISDTGIGRDEILISEGRLHSYIEQLTDKLPDGAKTAAKYGLVAKDTALFQGLQKAVEYGDFLGKAILFDHLKDAKKLSQEDALAAITEEFVNYDLLAGRFREYGENIGLWWFTAFKIRSAKIAASILRNNPLHALFGLVAGSHTFNSIDSPLTDNVFSKALDGDLGYSLGMGQAFRAPMLNPWANLAH